MLFSLNDTFMQDLVVASPKIFGTHLHVNSHTYKFYMSVEMILCTMM